MVGTPWRGLLLRGQGNLAKDTFEVSMLPKQQDTTHRSFFSDDQGKIRVDETKEADESSEVLKAD